MSVKLATKHGANYFNVLPPGSNDVAIFIGQNEGNEWTGVLPSDGEYKVRVYLMRSAARRNEVANYTLKVSTRLRPPGGVMCTSALPGLPRMTPNWHSMGLSLPMRHGSGPVAWYCCLLYTSRCV